MVLSYLGRSEAVAPFLHTRLAIGIVFANGVALKMDRSLDAHPSLIIGVFGDDC
jgi:hypothetical protein